MDKMKDSGSLAVGSIPAGGTFKNANNLLVRLLGFLVDCFCPFFVPQLRLYEKTPLFEVLSLHLKTMSFSTSIYTAKIHIF